MRTSRIGRGMTKVISMVLAFAMVMGGIFVWSDVEAQALGTATVMELNGTEVTSDAINFPAVGQTFTDSSGMAWRVLHEDAAGNRLIITEFVHTFAQYNTVRAWLPLAQAPIRTVLDNWVLATEVAASALTPVGAGHDVRFTVGNFDPAENEAAGRTLAGEPIPVADASNGLFLLSISEVNQYFANDETRIAFYAGLTVVPTYWWLRSPGGVGAQAEAVVVQYRPVAISTQIASTTHGGVRPALWVDGGEVGCPCDTYPCDCCDDCGTYPCDCCDTCGTYPCDCCDTCGTYPCDCCDTCGTYPCDCCDTCGTYPCDCCDTCGTYPCDCCDICGTYPCDCGPGGCNCGEPGGCDCGEPGGCDCGEPGGCDCGEPGGCDCGEPGGCDCGEPGGCDCGEPGGCDCGEPGGCDCGEPGGSCDCGELGDCECNEFGCACNDVEETCDCPDCTCEVCECDEFCECPPEFHPAYMFGDESGNFLPTAQITRAQVAAILARTQLLDFEENVRRLPPGMTSFTAFSDVGPNNWFFFYVAWAYDADLVQGYRGSFRPNEPITRQELAAMIARLGTVYPANTTPFPDAGDASNWAGRYVYTVYRLGLMRGDQNGYLHPLRDITRVETATAMNRILERIDSREAFEATEVASLYNARQFPDVSAGTWYFPSVVAAANDHYVTRDDDGVIDWKKLPLR